MRDIKTLLQLMLDNKQLFSTGLCGFTGTLRNNGIITTEELWYVDKYISSNVPTDSFLYKLFSNKKVRESLNMRGYWYPCGWFYPRKRWIKKHINLQ
jgi:hypothetical protein